MSKKTKLHENIKFITKDLPILNSSGNGIFNNFNVVSVIRLVY